MAEQAVMASASASDVDALDRHEPILTTDTVQVSILGETIEVWIEDDLEDMGQARCCYTVDEARAIANAMLTAVAKLEETDG